MVALAAVSFPAQAVTRDTLRDRANTYYGLSITSFMSYSRAHDGKTADGSSTSAEDTSWLGLDWRNDGCSAPDWLVGKPWNTYFKSPCVRHDFGYRNFGKGKALHSTNAKKLAVDDKFLADMKARCRDGSKRPWVYYSDGSRRRATLSQCDSKASTFYTGVRKSFAGSTGITNPENSWHARKCTAGALCLFDDTGYSDRRLTFGSKAGYPTDSGATRVYDMNDISFGDKTSSVWNRSAYAWRLYDDHGYSDRSVCVVPGQKISSLGDHAGFSDKTSSIKRMAGSSC